MSKSKRAEPELLKNIKEAIVRIEKYAADIEYVEFLEDVKTQDVS